jgi:hypothetical protein
MCSGSRAATSVATIGANGWIPSFPALASDITTRRRSRR